MLDLRCKLLLLTAFVGQGDADRFLSVWPDEVTIRNGANRHRSYALAMHWHGAAPDSWFSHLAVEVPGDEPSNEWLEAVDNTAYFRATEWLEHLEISEK